MRFLDRLMSSPARDILQGYTDWHCHILPGVDDGVKTMQDSLAILAEYEKCGVRNVFLTPHIMVDIPNETAALKARFEELKQAYKGPITLNLAAENMIDNLFTGRFEERDLLTLPGNRLLVETSYFNPPVDLRGKLRELCRAGYNPVLAHPERYEYMSRHMYDTLADMEIEFQLNLPSLTGYYGKGVKARAEWLLEEGFYTFSGTDLHRMPQLKSFLDAKIRRSAMEDLEDTVLDVSEILG